MFDVYFNPSKGWWTQIKFTMVHGFIVGLGWGIGMSFLIILLGYLHLIPKWMLK